MSLISHIKHQKSLRHHFEKLKTDAKRGDTIIEVMFALSVFCLVAVISIAMMNVGVAQAENSLELVVTRNELNAQAEALRFIHSSYISEMTLPTCSSDLDEGEKCQQYAKLWEKIINNAINPADAGEITDLETTLFTRSETGGLAGCSRVYEGGDKSILSRNKAFILNTRDLNSTNLNGIFNVSVSYVSAINNVSDDSNSNKQFVPAPLNARIIFTRPNITETGDTTNSTTQFTDGNGLTYNRVSQTEGIWIVALTDGSGSISTTQYYDFYIQSCWYGPNTTSPTTIDTVIRLYNPENV